MADRSGIEWTDATWNPVTGCTEVSPGCDRCYARTFAERWRGVPGHHFEQGFDLVLRPERLDQPLRWRRPRRIFVNSMSDLFHKDVPDEFITRVFDVMEQADQHSFQILTKRHARLQSFVTERQRRKQEFAAQFISGRSEALLNSSAAQAARARSTSSPPNIWLGVSVENQQWADIRIPALLNTPAAVRWLSCEPLLGPVLLQDWVQPPCGCCTDHPGRKCVNDPGQLSVDWVVVGGESGHGARPMQPAWARSLRDQCQDTEVPFLFKQWGGRTPKAGGRELDGRIHDGYPNS
jgi:protein gp37